MRIFPKEPEIGDYDGFLPEIDIFERVKFGEKLKTLFERVEDPMVAVLDAPWGSGKTTFVKMWCGHMRNNGFPVVCFDAFKNDYIGDPLVAMAGEIVALADALNLSEGEERKGFVHNTLQVSKRVGWAAMKGGVKKAASKLIGEEGLGEVVDAMSNDAVSAGLDLFDAAIRSKIEGRNEDREIFSHFSASLTALAKAMSDKHHDDRKEGDGDRPLIFVIDELDRCRPDYALDLIEKIKHFFNVEGVHFLLVTHLNQLSNSICCAYGENIDSKIYMQKFYNIVLSFPIDSQYHMDSIYHRLLLYIGNNYLFFEKSEREYFKEILIAFARKDNLSFRSFERILTYHSLISLSSSKTAYVEPYILVPVAVMRVLYPDIFNKMFLNKISIDDIKMLCNYGDGTIDIDKAYLNRVISMWSFFLCEDGGEEPEKWKKHFSNYDIYNPRELVHNMAQWISSLSGI